jgi:tungstate transport system substrate-binding protein
MTLGKTFALSSFVSLFFTLSALGSEYIIIQSTTSTQNSGLLSSILPKFEAHSGIKARVVAVGTGQALKNAQNGDGDVLLVHARSAEEAFVKDGWGVQRFDVMYNDFVIVGPAEDPAKVLDLQNVTAALSQIAYTEALFVSRGDDSGTHKAEMRLWSKTLVDTASASGTWYRETGSGMGATLNMAASMGAYTLTDRASWLSFANKRNLAVLVHGDKRLFNQYGVIAVNSHKHPNVDAEGAQAFIDWLIGSEGQLAISNFRPNDMQLFFPNAKR